MENLDLFVSALGAKAKKVQIKSPDSWGAWVEFELATVPMRAYISNEDGSYRIYARFTADQRQSLPIKWYDFIGVFELCGNVKAARLIAARLEKALPQLLEAFNIADNYLNKKAENKRKTEENETWLLAHYPAQNTQNMVVGKTKAQAIASHDSFELRLRDLSRAEVAQVMELLQSFAS